MKKGINNEARFTIYAYAQYADAESKLAKHVTRYDRVLNSWRYFVQRILKSILPDELMTTISVFSSPLLFSFKTTNDTVCLVANEQKAEGREIPVNSETKID